MGSRVELVISDRAELRSLRQWLDLAGVRTEQLTAPARPGEQGAGDYLTVVATAVPVVIAAIRTLPDFLRSRRTTTTVTVKTTDRHGASKEITVTGENLDEEATRRLLGD